MKKKRDSEGILKLFGVLLIIILLAFATGSFFTNRLKPKPQTEYSNGFTFTKSGKFWYTTILNPLAHQEINADFRYPPSEVRNITVTGDPKNFLRLIEQNNLTGAYITFNFEENQTSATTLAAADLSKFLKVINGITLVPACTSNTTDVCNTRPIVTCENQEGKALVIYIKNNNVPKITMSKNCLILEGTGDSLIRSYLKTMFIWYGVL